MFIIDAHLDLAYNALRGRDVINSVRDRPSEADGVTPTVSFADLRDGGVGLCCATIYCSPFDAQRSEGYRTADEARDMAQQQLDWYRRQQADGRLRIVTSGNQLPQVAPLSGGGPLAAVILMEGADPIRTPDEAADWFDAGVRMVSLAWKATRYAGGTGQPGPLTADGVELVRHLDRVGMIHDVSHLAEQSFWQLLEQTAGPVAATHANCRAIVPTDRQLSDDMIRALAARDGVIGMVLYDKFLVSPDEYGVRKATLADVVQHIRHIADLVGHTRCIGIGSDMDGGFGREKVPAEIATSADLPRLADALAQANFSDGDIHAILAGNWRRFLHNALPGESLVSHPPT
jgi:membrane dipeptidase